MRRLEVDVCVGVGGLEVANVCGGTVEVHLLVAALALDRGRSLPNPEVTPVLEYSRQYNSN